MQSRPVEEHSASAPERSRPVSLGPPQRMHGALPAPHGWRRGLGDEVPPAGGTSSARPTSRVASARRISPINTSRSTEISG
jgi:hypothetical protein